MSRLRLTCIAVAAVAVVTLSGCGRDQPAQVGTTVIQVADREAMPSISGTTLDGGAFDLADLRGRVVVLNSWASWCAPCRAETPGFVTLADATDPSDVAVVGLNVNDDPRDARDFVDEFAMRYPSLVDGDGSILRTIPGVPPSALPSTVIIDREGRIAVRIIGEADPDRLAELVSQVAAADPQGSSPS